MGLSEDVSTPSYFTCTLGEAELFNQQLDNPAPYTTVNGFIDYLVESKGDRIAVGTVSPSWASNGEGQEEWSVEALSKLY
jgi:hypothetical protein